VAVGVETKQDWDFLQGLGCTYAQGYYIAKPMPVEDFPGWLADWQHFF
jgi:EAL domain-containing protein (putative c-di-GMP-specific phosphodiesterase class I)